MSERISLTRIIAIHWYGFRQIFDVDDNVLISGAFGTGKSALLDLMQYVLLGEHWRANRAAAGSARGRDLVGYCLGDTNQMRNGQRHFLRQSGITIAALEFTRPAARGDAKPRRETWGIRLEYSSPDAAPKATYFCIPDRLDYVALAPGGKLMLEEPFRAWIRREYGNENIFSRQRDYLEEMAAPRHLNFDSAAFQRTFPKAIAFELEENVEKFIREFILEESPLDVREVRSALRAYDDTRKRLEKQEDEAAFLRRIQEQHLLCESSRRESAVLLHLEQRLRFSQAGEACERHAAEIRRLEEEHADDLKKLEEARGEAGRLEKLLNEVRFEIQNDPQGGQLDQLERQRMDAHARVEFLREVRKSTRARLDERARQWVNWLKHGNALKLEGLEAALDPQDLPVSALRSGSDAERLAVLPELARQFNEIWVAVERWLPPLKQALSGADKRVRQLTEDLERLSEGLSPGSFPLLSAAREKLADRVEQLGRLIEVNPDAERWWPALEMFLGSHRWALVVQDPDDYRVILELLRRTIPGREPEALLNPVEARSHRAGALPGSLFEKVTVKNPVARLFVQQLLGDVACVETLEELESSSHPRAVMPDGTVKDSPLRRRLKPASAVELTLGTEGLKRMRSTKLSELSDARTEAASLKQRLDDIHTWLDTGRRDGLGDGALPERAGELPQLPELESKLGQLKETIALISTPERAARQQRFLELEESMRQTVSRIAVLTDHRNRFELTVRPVREALDRAREESARSRLEMETSRTDLASRFPGILDSDLGSRCESYRSRFPRWQECFNAVLAEAALAGKNEAEARQRRNSEREKLATVRTDHGQLKHPEYQDDFAVEDEQNDRWSNRLRDLDSVELARSRELAADRKKEWERRLEENVLNELNRRINDAQNTIRLLDRYLSQPVGRYRYRIHQTRDNTGYGPFWRLLESGLEATDPLLGAISNNEVQKAKEELMLAVDAPDQGDDRVRRLLDYRNYHRYDVHMVPVDRPDAPPISLSRAGRNLSGGESQAPFFISMLAAFRRVYDRGDRASAKSQQLGLVVMDEAFSKLSGDGIEDCLALARVFQLQLVMAFPPERLGVMVPHAQTVVMCQKEVERDADGYVRSITNIPLLTTMSEAMEALS